ncbi:MAG: sulfate transporter CysZ [Cardiobacteriaceae bacterium]|nr:sulfate transporter CysZ [Cardiobacteriaceae bacterium]
MNALHCLAEGFSWLLRPGIRRFIFIPLLINCMLFSVGSYTAFHYGNIWIHYFLPQWLAWLHWLLYPLIAITLVIVIFYTFSLVANLIAAPFNSLLAEAVEKMETGNLTAIQQPLWQEIVTSVGQEIHKILYFLSLAIPTFIIGLILPPFAPIIWFCYSAWCAALQYMDYPMTNHGIAFRKQRQLLRARRIDSLGYGGIVTFMTTIPLLNLIAMPVSVIAATLYYCRHIRHS